MDEQLKIVLKLFKLDIGIKSEIKDELFRSLIKAAADELNAKFPLNLESAEDQILLTDFAAWKYRTRTEGPEISVNLQYRIRNRIARGRVKDE